MTKDTDLMENRLYVIVGASRGLGASLVSKYLKAGQNVVGIGRTNGGAIEGMTTWDKTGRFRYVQADVGDPKCVNALRAITEGCNGRPLCVIFNAAVIESDVGTEGSLKFDVFKKVNYTGIDGLCHVLEAFSEYLTTNGDMLVGISSFSAWVPPIRGNKVAYPASKAYLDMLLRSLRFLWNKRVHIMTVHLGHLGPGGSGSWFVTDYDMVAERVTKATLHAHPPEDICIPVLYSIVYRILKMIPDRVGAGAVELMKGLLDRTLPGKTQA